MDIISIAAPFVIATVAWLAAGSALAVTLGAVIRNRDTQVAPSLDADALLRDLATHQPQR